MCTAISWRASCQLFGRNLDLDTTYNAQMVITPRLYPFEFHNGIHAETHFALLGVAHVEEGIPLYYEAVNEVGLCAAALRFTPSAYYPHQIKKTKTIAPYEVISFLLSQCKSVKEAKEIMSGFVIADVSFSDKLPNTPLHWLISDRNENMVIEPLKEGMCVIENPIGVLTNHPPLDEQLKKVDETKILSAESDSVSRFIRAVRLKERMLCGENTADNVVQMFHLMGAVEQLKINDQKEHTLYTTCYDTESGTCYYRTYGQQEIRSVDMRRENMNDKSLICYSFEA